MGLTVVLLLIPLLPFTYGIAPSINGARRWVNLTVLTVQPSELAKFTVVVWTAMLAAKKGDQIRTFQRGLLPFLTILAPVIALIFFEPNLSMALLVGLLAGVVLFAAGARIGHFLALGVVCAHSVRRRGDAPVPTRAVDHVSQSGERADRGSGSDQSLGIGAGRLFGLGSARGSKSRLPPYAYSDFIFSTIGEEWAPGHQRDPLLFATFVGGLPHRPTATDRFGQLLAVGLTGLIGSPRCCTSRTLALLPATGVTRLIHWGPSPSFARGDRVLMSSAEDERRGGRRRNEGVDCRGAPAGTSCRRWLAQALCAARSDYNHAVGAERGIEAQLLPRYPTVSIAAMEPSTSPLWAQHGLRSSRAGVARRRPVLDAELRLWSSHRRLRGRTDRVARARVACDRPRSRMRSGSRDPLAAGRARSAALDFRSASPPRSRRGPQVSPSATRFVHPRPAIGRPRCESWASIPATVRVVFGGSQGPGAERTLAGVLSRGLLPLANVVWGRDGSAAALAHARGRSCSGARFFDPMTTVYRAADLVVCRSGAYRGGALCWGKASVLVPLPSAASDHQSTPPAHSPMPAPPFCFQNETSRPTRSRLVTDLLGIPSVDSLRPTRGIGATLRQPARLRQKS